MKLFEPVPIWTRDCFGLSIFSIIFINFKLWKLKNWFRLIGSDLFDTWAFGKKTTAVLVRPSRASNDRYISLVGVYMGTYKIWGFNKNYLGRDSGQIKLKSELKSRAFAQRIFSWSSSSFGFLQLFSSKKYLKIRTFFVQGFDILVVGVGLVNIIGFWWLADVEGWTVYIAMVIFKYSPRTSTSIGILDFNSFYDLRITNLTVIISKISPYKDLLTKLGRTESQIGLNSQTDLKKCVWVQDRVLFMLRIP